MTSPNIPGYVYLLGHGRWEKVGVAASLSRVRDHARHGWTDTDPRVGGPTLVVDPRGLEGGVLDTVGGRKGDGGRQCSKCGAWKPDVGRNGADGLWEIRHVDCWNSMRPEFEARYAVAAKVERADVLALTFDPAQCSATGFRFADSWIFPADPAERRSFNANMVGVKASAGSVLDVIDEAHGRGEVNLRRAAAEAFPGLLVRFDGEPLARQWGATGGGGSGSSTDDGSTFERNLGRCIVDGVGVVLVHLRSSNSLLAYASHSVIPSSA